MIKLNNYFCLLLAFFTKNLLIALEPPKTLVIKDLIDTKNELEVEFNDILILHYEGWLFDEKIDSGNYCDAKGEKFGSSTETINNIPPYGLFRFRIGRGLVISGWEIGLLKMKKGNKRCLVVPHQLGYGHRGLPDIIPAYSALIFEVELVDILKDKESE